MVSSTPRQGLVADLKISESGALAQRCETFLSLKPEHSVAHDIGKLPARIISLPSIPGTLP